LQAAVRRRLQQALAPAGTPAAAPAAAVAAAGHSPGHAPGARPAADLAGNIGELLHLPKDLAVARATRQGLRSEGFAPDAGDGGRDSMVLGEVATLDPDDLFAGSEATLATAFVLPRDGYLPSSSISRSET